MIKSLNKSSLTRYDHQLISNWVETGSRVIDLGCGNGKLLKHLQLEKGVTGYGVELDPSMISQCIDNDINVIQFNLDRGLGHFDTNSFDTVILSLTLQSMRRPKDLLVEMMRVGKQGIVTFPNFAHWRNRWQIAMSGKMPESKQLPYHWFDTPNIHLCTIKDFHALCKELGFELESSVAVREDGKETVGLKLFPNLFGEIALCRFSKPLK
ncbi:MAG: methionine biosynthesis protein MetW [Gammaproteobacteria bacterium]|nr:methionine biosynthesis protein MetW [Gammaproteobacteria bacterium]